jgi:hypothetical protein
LEQHLDFQGFARTRRKGEGMSQARI